MPLTVLVADATSWCRTTIRRLLQGHASVVGEAHTVAETVSLAGDLCPDVVLLDMAFGDAEHGSLPQRIRTAWPWAKVILTTSHGEELYLSSTGRTGADALLPKRSLRSGLVNTILQVAGRATGYVRERRHAPQAWASRRYLGLERRRWSSGT